MDKKNILYEMIDRRGKNINRLAIVAGLLSRKLKTTDLTLNAESLEKSFIDFRNVTNIEIKAEDRIILLKNE